MSFFKKLFAVGSSVAMVASGLLMPSAALAAAHGPGSVVKEPGSQTVWFIKDTGRKAAFTSGGAFMSYGFLSFAQVVDANSDDMSLPTDPFIAPRDGSVFCATMTKGTDVAGECSLITGGMKAAFTSAAVFAGQGYSFARAHYGDSSFLAKTSNIDNAGAAHRQGALVNFSGTVYLMGTTTLLGIPSVDVFNSWGYSFADVVIANAADNSIPKSGVMCARVPGQLNPSFTAGSCGDPNPNPNPVDCADLQGNAGDITVTENGNYSGEEVGEGEEEVGVLGFDVEADDDSDVAVTSVKVTLEETGGVLGVSSDLDDYASEVQVMFGDEVVGTADVDDFSESGDVFSKSISLDCSAVEAGETGEFTVSVTALDNIDSVDMADDEWTVELTQVRFEDADGVTTTESGFATIDETFDFVDFATAADVELRTALNDADDDINEAHNVTIDDDNTTDNEEVLSFTLRADGDSDINVDTIPVTVTTDHTDLDEVISRVALYHDGIQVDSVSVSLAPADDTETFDFEDLDIDIGAGDTEEFMVKVNIRPIDEGVNFDQGTTLQAEVDTANIEAEDEEGDDVTDLTGSAIGEEISLFSQGIAVEVNSAVATVNSNDGAGDDDITFTWELTITNVGDDDVYINEDAVDIVDADSTDTEIIYSVEENGTTLGNFSGTITDDTSAAESFDDDDVTTTIDENYFKIAAGDSEDFTITVTATNTLGSGQVRAMLEDIEWTTEVPTDAGAITDGDVNDYIANLADDSRTAYKLVN